MATFLYSFAKPDNSALKGAAVSMFRKGNSSKPLFRGKTDNAGRIAIELDGLKDQDELVVTVTDPKTREELYRSKPTRVKDIPGSSHIVIGKRTTDDEDDDDKTVPDLPAPLPQKNLAESVAERITTERKVSEALRKVTRPELTRRLSNRADGAALGKKLLGRRPLGKLGGSHVFVPRDEDPGPVLEQNRLDGLARIEGAHENRRGLTIREGALGIDNPQPGAVIPAGVAGQLVDFALNSTVAGSAVETILRRCAARMRTATEIHLPDESTEVDRPDRGDSGTEHGNGPVYDPTPAERVSAILDADSTANGASPRPTADTVRENLRSDIPSGPADADAYYDFHALQVAWSDAWTAMVDGVTDGKIKELYESIVEVVDPTDISPDFSEIDELHTMLDTLADSVSVMSSTLTAPSELAAWEPSIAEVWSNLSVYDQDYLRFLYAADGFVSSVRDDWTHDIDAAVAGYRNTYLYNMPQFEQYPRGYIPEQSLGALIADPDYFRDQAQGVTENAPDDPESSVAAARLGRAERLITELKEQLVEPYQFDVFAPGAYNFGVLATYRQRWRPIAYQAGDMAGSIALAPNEKRSYSITRKSSRKSTRGSEMDRMLGGSSESEETGRAEAEIVRTVKEESTSKANTSTSGSLFKIWQVGAGAEFGSRQDDSSSRTKKDIRESTRKAAQEYRDQRKVTVNLEETRETAFTEKREIENPNNELTVTYLFYELQRRYEVSERLHDLTPVIMVAYDMPAPHEITEAWLLKHDWIIRRVLLDDSFEPALRYLSQTFAGDEVSVEVLEQQWKTQLAVVTELKRQGGAHARLREEARQAIENAVADVAGLDWTDTASDIITALHPGIGKSLAEHLFPESEPMSETEGENARRALEWADADLAKIESVVRENLTSLERATSAYVAGVRKRLDRRTQIDRLILHVKENIFHYMQAIWDREHPDQRYLRLYDMGIQWPGASGDAVLQPTVVRSSRKVKTGNGASAKTPTVRGSAIFGRQQMTHLPDALQSAEQPEYGYLVFSTPAFRETRKLHQVADLLKPLGYRGNFAIFPLREHNALSTHMAQDFLDSQFGVSDPDPLGAMPTASEAIALAECAWRHGDLDEAGKNEVAEWLMSALDAAHQVSQEVVVPTGELFIEALPGAHPLLEDFKLKHRAYDAERARADAATAHIETLRRAMRLEQGDASDPDVDRIVKIEGDAVTTVPVAEA